MRFFVIVHRRGECEQMRFRRQFQWQTLPRVGETLLLPGHEYQATVERVVHDLTNPHNLPTVWIKSKTEEYGEKFPGPGWEEIWHGRS